MPCIRQKERTLPLRLRSGFFAPAIRRAGMAVGLLLALWALTAPAQDVRQFATNNLPVLTNAIQIQQLSSTNAAAHYPVQLRGVMTFTDSQAHYGFIQDDTAGTVVFWTNAIAPAKAGDLVELRGRTDANLYAASILSPVFKVIGHAPFPKPLRASFSDLNAGHADCQWTELDGQVLSTTTNEHFLYLSLSVQRNPVKVSVALLTPVNPATWVESRVRVRGVGIGSFNGKGQFAGAELVSPSLDEITMLQSARADIFSLPVTPVKLLGHKAEPPPGSRIRVRGVVTLFLPGAKLYLRDDACGMQIRTAQTEGFKPGDLVDATGYYQREDGELVIDNGICRVVGAAEPAVPISATEDGIIAGKYDDELVSMKARLLEWSHEPSERVMSLRGDGNTVFTARLADGPAKDEAPVGSLVQVTGVCRTTMDDDFDVTSFELLLRSPADLAVIQSPPWWTEQRIVWFAGGLGVLVFGALGWVSLLRKQVRRQTAKLQAEIEERKGMEAQVARTNQELVAASRRAGMADIATSVLHNVGNVLNSVNVSCSVVAGRVRAGRVSGLEKASALLTEHQDNLPEFFANDPKGKHFPGYLRKLADHLVQDKEQALVELENLTRNVEHVNKIIDMQQAYARMSGVREPLPVVELIEDALRLDAGSLERHHVKIHREYLVTPTILIDRHKTLQILVNLIRNARHALDDSGREDKLLTLRIDTADSGSVRVTVADNGVGIPPENLTRIFSQGFTTRKNGHGFGLHSGALAATEMGGSLTAQSDGPGCGASFVLTLPM
jgi:signal transduction histidine kinase